MDWKEEIVKLVFLKQTLSDVDVEGLWKCKLPNVAATDSEINQLKESLSFPLNDEYLAFLSASNGWSCFYQDVELFSIGDFLGGDIVQFSREQFNALDDAVFQSIGIARSDLLPIAVSTEDKDLFAISKNGEVYWFAGELIDRFPSFYEFYLAMLDYHREEINFWKEAQQ